MTGIASSPGVGAGSVFVLHEREVPLGRTGPNAASEASGATSHPRRGAESELERFTIGQRVAATYYRGLVERVKKNVGADEAEIFEGHLEIITGDDIAEAVEAAILEEDTIAERAVIDFTEQTAKEFEELESEYFQQRAADIRDIGRRLAEAIYYGSVTDPGELPEDSVIVAEELTPSATARLDTERVAAIATEKGGRTSHAAILARSLSIPCVTGISGLIGAVRTGQLVLVDGDRGLVETDVSRERLDEAKEAIAKNREQATSRRSWSKQAVSRFADGAPYEIHANVSGATEAELADGFGAGGVGLFRTEFLFMRYADFPDVDQQAAEYRAVCQTMSPTPVIVRLLDCGADKPLPYANHEPEDNPFLGERGIRFLLARENRLRAQIEAIARVAADGFAIKAMVPMVVSPQEIEAVRALVPPEASGLPVGTMVETPASVLAIDRLAAVSDFVSIGTNDLVQYVLAVDRGNANVASYYQEFHPAVLTSIKRVVEGCHAAGIHVGVCGDMASHPASALSLIALGVDELSASVASIPELKACFATIRKDALEDLAVRLLAAGSADEARSAAEELVPANLAPWVRP